MFAPRQGAAQAVHTGNRKAEVLFHFILRVSLICHAPVVRMISQLVAEWLPSGRKKSVAKLVESAGKFERHFEEFAELVHGVYLDACVDPTLLPLI